MVSLNIGEKDSSLRIDGKTLLTGLTVFIGPPGSGKSNAVSVMCEELIAQDYKFAIINSEGEYRNIEQLGAISHVTAQKYPFNPI
jgi:Ni2+-binding GTPase involved in maturation of urease and hydrogenase